MCEPYHRHPLVKAEQFDGSLSGSRMMITWVKSSPHGQTLGYDGERLILKNLDGTRRPVSEGWWLVKTDEGLFEIRSNAEFHEMYDTSGDTNA